MTDSQEIIASWMGFCPICQQNTRFTARNTWFRDALLCETCDGGSIPRERALMLTIRQLLPHYADLAIHESSPVHRGVSRLLATEAPGYVATQFFPGVPPGTMHNGVRCEDLERQTFPSESFDFVVTQDVMEHVFHPENAYSEIYRTLRPGGYHIHTTPIYKSNVETQQKARLSSNGSIEYLAEPEYHGNPLTEQGSLVTFHYGYDLADLIAKWTPFDVEIRRFADRTHGITAEFTEVIICSKPPRAVPAAVLPCATEAAALRSCVAAQETSTFWRVTHPLRAFARLIGAPDRDRGTRRP
jgi:SAM-dependent methyltransferase